MDGTARRRAYGPFARHYAVLYLILYRSMVVLRYTNSIESIFVHYTYRRKLLDLWTVSYLPTVHTYIVGAIEYLGVSIYTKPAHRLNPAARPPTPPPP